VGKNPRSRNSRELRRHIGKRPSHDRVLIVCEGEKTECNYFDEIRQRLRISSAHIHVIPSESGTDPKSVVRSAEQAFERNGKSFEKVYAVFDRDDYIDYANAIHMASGKNGKLKNDEKQSIVFETIVSVACFEFWLLLHFSDVQHRIHRNTVLQQLGNHILDYAKGMPNLFDRTEALLSTAIQRATLLKQKFQRIPCDDPYTDVHELVSLLRSLSAIR
jgi:hypothetical protein